MSAAAPDGAVREPSRRSARHRATPEPSPRYTGARRALLAAALLATVLLTGMTTNALWTARDSAAIGVITSGDLDIELVGDIAWTELSADGVPLATIEDPASYRVMPDDRFSLSQQFTTRLDGDNLDGRLTLDWAQANELPPGVQLSYQVLDAAGMPVSLGAYTPLGVPVDIEMSDEQSWSFVVEAHFPGGRPQVRSATPFELGPLMVHLEQVLPSE